MTSPIGRVVERASYADVILFALVVIAVSTTWFRFAPQGNGLKDDGASILDCAYFSLVTFTTLGYGDLNPVGFCRSMAILDVLSGLSSTAVFIGKVASERQSSMLLLLHTSDTQRRISEFSEELRALRNLLDPRHGHVEPQKLRAVLESHLRLTKAIGNYLLFNANQASVIQFGNFTALIGLYDETRVSFGILNDLLRSATALSDGVIMRRCLSNMNNLHRVVKRMDALHHRTVGREPIWQTILQILGLRNPMKPSTVEQSARNRAEALLTTTTKIILDAETWVKTGYHSLQIERVYDAFPNIRRTAWPVGIHKTIASKLRISNNVSSRCITMLIEQDRLPKS